MELRAMARSLFAGFWLPQRSFLEDGFLPEARPKSLFEALRSTRRIGPVRVSVGAILVAAFLGLGLAGASANSGSQVSAPINVNATAGPGTMTVTWGAPSDTANQTLRYYNVMISTDGMNWSNALEAQVFGTSHQFTNLSPSTAYYSRVQAVTSLGGTGAWGYDWELAYRTTQSTRGSSSAFTYTTSAGTSNRTDFSRVRYIISGTSGNFVDLDFNKNLTSLRHSSAGYNSLARLQVPTTTSPNNFTIAGQAEDLTVRTNLPSTTVQKGSGLRGHVEIWPWNYRSDGGLAGSSNSLYDWSDSPTGAGGHGSFQIHTNNSSNPSSNKTIVGWNDLAASFPEGGFGNAPSGKHPDWTFTDASALQNFFFESYANHPVTTPAATAPGAPTSVTATATGTATATVSFTQPASNGGAAITRYSVTSSPSGGTGSVNQAGSGTINVTGLQQNTQYTFTVRATNSAGTSVASSASNSITTAPITHVVTFNANNGSGTMPTQTVNQATATPLNPNTFERGGFVFRGWNYSANGTGQNINDQGSVTTSSALTLYAMWTSLEDRAWTAALQQDIFTTTTPIPTATNAAFTAEAWIYPTVGTGTWRNVFGSGTASNNESQRFFVGLHNSNQMYLSVGTAVETSFDTNIKFNEWTHIAIAVSASTTPTIDVYVNGRLLRQFVNAANRQIIGSYFTIGSNPNPNYYWTGEIDQVKVWENYLNVNQVAESMHVYQKGSLTAGSTLRAHYDFNEYNPGALLNRAGSNYNMTMSNSVDGDRFSSSRIIDTGTAHSLQSYVKFNRSYLTAAGGWTPPSNISKVKALVVAGGGGGGTWVGGGGGAGGALQVPSLTVSSGAVPVVVGQGGLGAKFQAGSGSTTFSQLASAGRNSSLGSAVATGGGNGASWNLYSTGQNAGSGGSGGGGVGYSSRADATGGAETAGQGFPGGNGLSSTLYSSGGGGGAGGSGQAGRTNGSGNGGAGVTTYFTGTTGLQVAGGGGGGNHDPGQAVGTASFGGGAGAQDTNVQAGSGQKNTGGGGGGSGGNASFYNSWGGDGGSGVVILSYGATMEVSQTPGGARAGINFQRPIAVQLKNVDGTNYTGADQQVTLSAATNSVLQQTVNGVTSNIQSITTTSQSGVASFSGIGFQSGVGSSAQTLTVTADAFVSTSLSVTPTFIASTINITSSGPTNGSFVDGVFQSSTSSAANILNSDLVTAMGSGSVLVESSGAINVQADVSSPTAGSSLTLKTNTNIQISANVAVQTNNADLIFWTDADSTNGGFFNAAAGVALNTANGSTSQLTGGGKLVIAGGADNGANGGVEGDGIPDGFARSITGQNSGDAVVLAGARQSNAFVAHTGGGDITIRGHSSSRMGIFAQGELVMKAGDGQIVIDAKSDSTISSDGSNTHAFEFNGHSVASLIESSSPINPAISITGRATGNQSDSWGLSFWSGTPPNSMLISAKGPGGVFLAGRNTQTDAGSIRMNGVSVHSQTGPIVIEAEGSSSTNDVSSIDLRSVKSRFGAFGDLTSSADITIRADEYVNLSETNKTEFNTTGTVTIESVTAGFRNGLSLNSAFDFNSATGGLVVGKPGTLSGSNFTGGNSTDLTFSSPISIAGPISGFGSNIFVSENVTTTGAGSKVLLRTPGNINVGTHSTSASNPGKQIQTNGGSIVLWSDSDSNGAGLVRLLNNAQLCTVSADCTTTTSGGGDIVIGGGAADANDSSRPAGFANGTGSTYANDGTSTTTGIQVGTLDRGGQGARLYSAGGNIVLRGASTNDGTNNWKSGIGVVGGTVINSRAGTILLEATHRSSSTNGSSGAIEFNAWGGGGGVSISSANTSATAVVVRAYQNGGTSDHMGVWGGNESTTFNVSGGLLFDVERLSDNIGFVFNVSGPLEIKPYGTTLRNSGTASDFKFNSGKISFTTPPSAITIGSLTNTSGILVGTSLSASAGNIELLTSGNTTVSASTNTAGDLVIRGAIVEINADQETTAGGDITITPSAGYSGTGALNSAGGLSISGGTSVAPNGPFQAVGNITLSGESFSQSSSSATLFATASGSVIRLVADTSASLSANVTAGNNGVVAFETRTSGSAIRVGGTTPSPSLLLVAAHLQDRVSATTLRIGDRESTGDVVFNSSLTLTNVQNLAIRSSGDVSAIGVTVLVANLGIDAGGDINWPNDNGTSTLVALNASSVTFNQSANYSVAAVDGIDPEFGQGVKFVMEGVDRTNTVDRFMAVTFNPPPVVKIQDKFGNVLAASNDSAADYTVTAAMTVTGSSTGTPTLEGNSATSSGGTHTYTNLRVIDGTGAVSISFTVTRDSDSFSLVDAESSDSPQATAVVINYLVKAGEPASISVVFTSETTRAGIAELKPTVTLLDTQGNRLTEGDLRNTKVTVSITGDTGRILGGDDVATVDGLVSFPNLSIAGKIASATRYTLTFTVNFTNFSQQEITLTTSREISLTAGVATKLALSEDSQTVATRATLSEIVVSVQDDYENVVALAKDIEVAVSTGSAFGQAVTFTGTRDRSTPAGVGSVSYSDLVLQGKADTYTLTFSSDNLASTTHTVRLAHGAANSLTITGPANAANDKDFDTDVVVSIFDADDNPVTTGPQSIQSVALSSATTLTGTREVSASGGIATFTADTLRLIGTEGSRTVTATVLSPSSITADLSVQLGFGDATQLALTTQAAGIANRITFATDPVITVQDSSGNTVTNYAPEIVVASTGVVQGVSASLFGDLDLAPTTGVATFTDLELRGTVGQYDLTFSSGNLTVATQRVSLTHGAAFAVVVSGPSEADNDLNFGSQVSVVLRDQDQNVVTSGADSSRNVVASNADANTVLSGTTTVTATAGRATFTNLRLTGPAGSKTVALTWGSTPTLAANLVVELGHGVATQLVLTQDAASATSRAVFGTQPIVSVRDVSGNPVSDFVGRVTVDVSRAGTSVPFALTGANGQPLNGSPTATFSGVGLFGEVGTYTLTYSSTDLASATQTIVLGHGVATQLDLTTSAAGFVNRVAFATQPSITVRDQDGNPVLNYATDIEVTSAPVDVNANAEITGTLSRPPSSGVATFTNLRLDGKVGQHDLTFSSGALATANQRVTLTHGVATAVVLTGATTAANDRTFGSAVVVEIQDADANRVTTGASADQALTLSAVSADQSSVTLAGDTGLTVAGGVATLSNLKLTGLAGTKTLTATVSTPSLSGTRDIELGHGYATKLVITQAASEAVSREAFGVQPIITVQDVSGNPVSDFEGEVSAEVFRAGTAIPYALTGTITRTLSGSPTATFTNLGLFGQVGTYSITYLAVDDRTGLSLSTVGQSISLAHGSATQVEVVAASTIANAAPLGDVTATIRDQDGNPVTTGTPEVVLSISGTTTVSLVGAAPVNATNGVATFSGVSILGLEEQKVLTATVASLSNLSGSANVELTFGAATQLAIISGVTEAVNRQPFTSGTVIEARDSSGNPVDTFSGDVSVSATTGSGVVTGTLTKTATSSPRVTFSDLEIEGDVDSYVLTFTSTGLENITQAVELTHGEAHSLLLQMTTTAKNNEDIPDVVVRILDEDENLVTSGTPQITLSGSDLTGTLQTNASGGIATFTALRFVGDVATVKYVTATLASPSITSNQVTVTLSHGDATQMVLTTSGSGAVNRAGMTQVPVVTLRDISGNPVLDSTATVTVSETSVGSAAADISGTVSRTPVNGVVTFTGLGLNGRAGQYTLTFEATGLTDITQSITLTHGAAVKLAVAASADVARSGLFFDELPVIWLFDQDNNVVTTDSEPKAEVTVSLVGSGLPVVLDGDTTVDAFEGEAAFMEVGLTGTAGLYSLEYSSLGLEPVSQTIELLAGEVSSIKIVSGPVNKIAGTQFASPVTAELLDAANNRVLSDSLSDITATLVSSSDVSSRGVSTTTVRVEQGLATFSGASALSYSLAGDHKISFSDGTRTLVSDSFTITHAAASKLALVTQPTGLRNDIPASVERTGPALVVEVLDQYNNKVVSGPSVSVVASVTSANSANVGPLEGHTAISSAGTELVSLPNLKLKGLADDYTLTLTATETGAPFTLVLSPIELTFGTPSALVITQSATVARSGVAFTPQPELEVRDVSGNLVSDSQLVVTATVAGRDMVGTNGRAASGGVVSFMGLGVKGQAATEVVVRFATEFENTLIEITQTVEVTAGDATKFVIIEQPQTVKTRSTFATSTALRLLDDFNNPVPTDNTTIVTGTLLHEGAPASASVDRTLPNISAQAVAGVVTFDGLALPVLPRSNYILRFELVDFSLLSDTFTVLPGDATKMTITRQPNSVGPNGLMKTGDLIPIQPQVTLYDEDNYVALGATGTVSVAVVGTGGSLSEGVITANIASGVADFSGVKLVGKPQQGTTSAEVYRLTFSHTPDGGSEFSSLPSNELNVTNADAASLTVFRGAATAQAGEVFETQPIIHIVDRFGNIVETGNDSVLQVSATSPDGGSLRGSSKPAVKGVATFTSLSLGGQVDRDYTLRFATVAKPSIAVAQQTGVRVTYGVGTQLFVRQLPLSEGGAGLTKSGEALAVQPIIEIHDDYGNVAEDEIRTISVTLNRIGTNLAIKDRLISGSMDAVNGVAEFTSLAIVGRPGERYSLTFSAFELDPINTSNVSGSEDLIVRHGDPTVLEISREPSSVISANLLTMTGSPLHVQPQLRLLDFDGNLATEISGVAVTASVIAQTGGEVVTEGGANQALFNGGSATFSNLAVVAVPGSEQVIRFTSTVRDNLLTSADSEPFSLTFAVAHRLAILTAPCAGELVAEVCQVGITGDNLGVQPRIEIQDRFGNRVLNYQGSVRVSTATSDGVLRNGALIPQASVSVPVEDGVATFTDLNLEATPSVGIELVFESSNLLPVTADEIKVLAAQASQLVVIADPVGARTGAALPIVPVVELRDRFGNRALSDDVTRVSVISLAGGSAAGTLSGELTVTATAGRATFTGLGFTGTPRSVYTLRFDAVDALGAPMQVESGTFFVTNAEAARIVMVQTATVSRTGDVMGDTVIELRDAFDNLAEDNSTTVVRVSIVAGDVTKPKRFVDGADQTVTNIEVTASAGVVRFSGLRLVGIPGDVIQLRFDATGHDPAFSGPLVLTHNEATSLSVTRGPVADLSGVALTTQPIILLFDRFGNSTTTDSSTVITASLYEGAGGELTAGTSVMAVNGVATFSGLTATGDPGTLYKLRFTSGAGNSVDDVTGFKVKKNAVTTLSYTATSFRPNGTVLPAFATDSDSVAKTFTTDSLEVCSVNSATGIVTMLTVGDCNVTVTIPNTDNFYSLAPVSATLKITKAAQSAMAIVVPQGQDTLEVDHLGTLPVSFTGGNGTGQLIYSVTGDCRVIGTTLLAGSAGAACAVRIERLGDRDYLDSTPSPWAPVTIRKIEPAELFIGNNPTVTGGEVQLFTRGGSGNGEIWFEKVNPAQSCTVSRAGLATSDASGTCTVRARQAESAHHLDNMTGNFVLTFNKVEQTVSFTSAVPQDVRVGQTYIPVAVASSELDVSYSIAAGSAGVCSIAPSSPFTVTFATVGLCEIVATQAGNSRFSSASATRPISVGLRNQTITFTLREPTLLFGTPAFMLSGTASSGEPVSYQVATSPTPACSVVGGRVTLTRAGVCVITATQPGIANVLAPATPVTQVLTVTPDLAGAPHLMSISVGDRSITSRFMPPGYLGGSAVSGYVMEVTNGSVTYSNYACSPTMSEPCTIAGIPRLTQGNFQVRVAAITDAGVGTFSEWSQAIAFREAGLAVRNLVAPISGDVLRLAWDAPLIRDGFTRYDIYIWPQGETSRPSEPSVPSVFDIDANGVDLNLVDLAETTTGLQIAVVTVVTPPSPLSVEQRMAVAKTIGFTTPSAPARIGISDMTDEILVAWSPPLQDGGQPVIGYQVFVNGELSCSVEINPATEVCPDANDMNFTVSELEPGGQYVIQVAAMNSLGLGEMRMIEHMMPALPSFAGPGSSFEGLPSLPGRPPRPGSGSGPNVMDPDSWSPATPDSSDTQGQEPTEPSEPTGPADGSDSSASGTDSSEANFTWLMLLIALAMFLVLLRVVIRGRKRKALG